MSYTYEKRGGGECRIADAADNRIATCYDEANAKVVVAALNGVAELSRLREELAAANSTVEQHEDLLRQQRNKLTTQAEGLQVIRGSLRAAREGCRDSRMKFVEQSKRADAAEARCKVLEAENGAWRAAWDGREGAGDEPRYADPAHDHSESGKWDGTGDWCDSCERFAYAEECRKATDASGAISRAEGKGNPT